MSCTIVKGHLLHKWDMPVALTELLYFLPWEWKLPTCWSWLNKNKNKKNLTLLCRWIKAPKTALLSNSAFWGFFVNPFKHNSCDSSTSPPTEVLLMTIIICAVSQDFMYFLIDNQSYIRPKLLHSKPFHLATPNSAADCIFVWVSF